MLGRDHSDVESKRSKADDSMLIRLVCVVADSEAFICHSDFLPDSDVDSGIQTETIASVTTHYILAGVPSSDMSHIDS